MKRLVGETRIERARLILDSARFLVAGQGVFTRHSSGAWIPAAHLTGIALTLCSREPNDEARSEVERYRAVTDGGVNELDVWCGARKVFFLYWACTSAPYHEVKIVTWKRGTWEETLIAAASGVAWDLRGPKLLAHERPDVPMWTPSGGPPRPLPELPGHRSLRRGEAIAREDLTFRRHPGVLEESR